ncbi:Ras-related and estrogen-regulated growth inhibitor [Anthophora quadrimaculata]
MKLLTVLCALVIQCAATKSWNNDSYSEETFSMFGWISHLKRFSLIALMLSGVVLYYVPESRPHARRICYALIDLTANGLKSALSPRESDYMCEKIKSKYQRARYEQLLQKRISQDMQFDEDSERMQRNYCKRSKVFLDNDVIVGKERKRLSGKQSREHKQSRHRFRNGVIKDVSAEPCMEVTKPVYFYSDKLEDIQKYLKTSLSSEKRANGSAVENYALLISGSPQEMAMLDQKYEKDDVVIVQDPYLRVEYKECGTSTDKISSKAEASSSEHEGPTRDHNDHATDSIMETYVKEVELNSIPEANTSRYSVNKSLYQTSQYQCGSGCCGPSGCSMAGETIDKETVDTLSPVDVKNVLKSSKSTVSSKILKKIEENEENSYTTNYNHKGNRSMKAINSSNIRRVEFQEEDISNRVRNSTQRKYEESEDQYESTSRGCKKKLRNDNSARTGFSCNNVSYLTDRGGEADDENSQPERVTMKHDLNERPQRDNHICRKDSTDSIFDYYEDIYNEPILKTIMRAVNWIFGGCPEASRRAALKRGKASVTNARSMTSNAIRGIRRKKSSLCEVKVAVIGAPGVGKSALTVRFLTRRYIGEYDHQSENRYKHEVLVDGEPILFEILDTCPKSEDELPSTETFQWADGLLLVYSIIDRSSFNFVRKAKETLAVVDPEATMPLALVGNKADMVHLRQVSTEEGEILAKDFECWFGEVSAAEQVTQVAESFHELCREVLAARRRNKQSLLDRMLGSKATRAYSRGKSDSALPKD